MAAEPYLPMAGAEASAKLPQDITCYRDDQNFHSAACMHTGAHVHLHACTHPDAPQHIAAISSVFTQKALLPGVWQS